jgi:mono/diheme cytochrome c family protein
MWALLIGCVSGLIAATPAEGQAGADRAAVERFETQVRPLLASRCWSCHGPEKSRGGLRLDSAAGLAAGGASGPVVVAGKPEESLLIEAVRYAGELRMPPKGKLRDAEIAGLIDWVRAGAVWPGAEPPPEPARASTPDESEPAFWAFQPPSDPTPPDVSRTDWPKSPIDRFILAGLERKGLSPAPPAEKRVLIRRATFDLTGLPPTPEEVDAFLDDSSPDAFARVVDRLLASPRYGERWGRHWLDLARYADSNGMDENVAYANAFRYRDYIIRAFNADAPYDRLIREQLAGDLLPPAHGADPFDLLTATGFLVLGPKMLAEDDPVKMEMDIIDEQVDTTGRVFLGLTLGCARCHDHKFDPIPTADYYALAGIFKSTKSMANHKVVAMWNERPLATGELQARAEAHRKEVERRKAEIKARASAVPPAPAEELKRLRQRLAEFEKSAPAIPMAMAVEEQKAANLRIHLRGSHLTLGAEVPRRFPVVLAGDRQDPINGDRSGRLELAAWLTRPDHPLTARVMVNRIWLWHFGEGLVRSPDNFGKLGDRPTHPELLDWLAKRFVESGWSLKAMHRAIMLSATYQMGARHDARAAQADPENRLHWRMNRHRLEAEAIRDAILAVSGELDPAMGGATLKATNHAYVYSTGGGRMAYDVNRRSVYLPVIRSALYDVFQAFDFADPSTANGQRVATTVAPQALFMLNDPLVLRGAEAMARRLLDGPDPDDQARLRIAYRIAYGRPPNREEIARASEYLRKFEASLARQGVAEAARPLRVWQALCQSLIASSEFIYID